MNLQFATRRVVVPRLARTMGKFLIYGALLSIVVIVIYRLTRHTTTAMDSSFVVGIWKKGNAIYTFQPKGQGKLQIGNSSYSFTYSTFFNAVGIGISDKASSKTIAPNHVGSVLPGGQQLRIEEPMGMKGIYLKQ